MEKMYELIRQPSRVVIITDKNSTPDGLSSSMALAAVLTRLRHNVIVILPNDFPPVFNYLNGIHKVIIGKLRPNDAIAACEKADIIFCLDFNSLDRIGRFGLDVMASRAYKVLIDHHDDPEPFADYLLSNPLASSTTELVYDFIVDMNLEYLMDIPIAESIYTGIISSTGSFFYNTNSRIFEIVSALKKIGINDQEIQIRLFDYITQKNRNYAYRIKG
jgi:bifunctional oligoribonuclease and PAP phosphatase NrnA